MQHPIKLSLIGYVIISLSFVMSGPVPGLGVDPSVELIIVSTGTAGIGFAINTVTSFARLNKAVIDQGYENDMNTSLLVSGKFFTPMNIHANI